MGDREKRVAQWNNICKTGDLVAFYKNKDSFSFQKERTQSEAYINAEGFPVVYLKGISSPVDLSKVKPWATRCIGLDEQVAFIQLELDKRSNTYPGLVKCGKMNMENAVDEIAKMSAVLKSLLDISVAEQLSLFEQ